MTKQPSPEPFPIRIPDDLRRSIEWSAKAKGQTLNSTIVAILTDAMSGDTGPRFLSASEREEIRVLVVDLTRRAVEDARATSDAGYLSVDELGDLIGCKTNQRCKMIAWLKENRWKYEVSSAGVPRVARLYHDRKLGIAEGPVNSKLSDEPYFKSRSEPDREGFANRPRGRKAGVA